MTRKYSLAFGLAGALLTLSLGACSGSSDEPTAENRPDAVVQTVDAPTPVASETPLPPAPPPPTVDANMTAEAPVEAPGAADEQMMDDASATGMTARSSRGEPAADEPAPAELPNNQ